MPPLGILSHTIGRKLWSAELCDWIWIYSNYIAEKAELHNSYRNFKIKVTSIYIKKVLKFTATIFNMTYLTYCTWQK